MQQRSILTGTRVLMCSALFSVLSIPAFAEDVTITQVGFTFDPQQVSVSAGDTITWIRSSGNHTITSGTDCNPDGLFNGTLSMSSTDFTYTIPEDALPGTISYFCSPHCELFEMTGQLDIEIDCQPADLDCSGNVNAADLATLLSLWGMSGSAGDINNDGFVNALDIASLLAAWGG